MIEKIRKIVESLGYPFFYGTREEVYAYINSVRTVVACYRQGGGGYKQFFVFKFKGEKPQRMYEEVMREIKRQFTVGVQRVFFYDDVLEARFPLMAKTYTEGGARPTPTDSKILYFEALESCTISMISTATIAPSLEYSYDGVNYLTWNHTTSGSQEEYEILNLNTGEKIYFKGINTTLANDNSHYSKFVFTGYIKGYGSVMSLIDGTGETETITSAYCFSRLFTGAHTLKKAPSLTATIITDSCYKHTFSNCDELTEAPETLPALILKDGCYSNMFYNCKKITKSPKILGISLGPDCFFAMFNECRLLSEIEVHVESWSTSYASNWVNNVYATGIFRKLSGTTIPTGSNGIPLGWTVENI